MIQGIRTHWCVSVGCLAMPQSPPIIAADSPHDVESPSFYPGKVCLNTAAGTSSFKWDPSTGLDFLTRMSDQHGSHQSAWVKVPIRNWTRLAYSLPLIFYHPSLCLLGEP